MDWRTVLSFKGKDGFGAARFGLSSLHPIRPLHCLHLLLTVELGRGSRPAYLLLDFS